MKNDSKKHYQLPFILLFTFCVHSLCKMGTRVEDIWYLYLELAVYGSRHNGTGGPLATQMRFVCEEMGIFRQCLLSNYVY